MQLNNDQKKHYRTIGHQLNPIVTIAEKGLNEPVNNEINRALDDHELIKVKINIRDRKQRQQIILDIAENAPATIVQTIGLMALFYRQAAKPNPRLSNILRFKPK